MKIDYLKDKANVDYLTGGVYTLIFKSIFLRFIKKKQCVNIPIESIPWNKIVDECYDMQLNFIYDIAKVIYTDDRTERAVILQKPDGLYTVTLEKLYPLNDDELKYELLDLHGFWQSYNSGGIFDTEERATNAIMAEPPFKYSKRPL